MIKKRLSLGISPCPNDTFIFHALAHGVFQELEWDMELTDVQELNEAALAGRLDVCKVSVGVVPRILGEYTLLRAGGALGRGVGPLLTALPGMRPADLDGAAVAVPGQDTTAFLLFSLWAQSQNVQPQPRAMVFHQVMEAVRLGKVQAGVVIHEGRFTYAAQGLALLADLGQWWEQETGLPLPLGAIAVRRSLGLELAMRIDAAIRDSLEQANAHPGEAMSWVRAHAQEMAQDVIEAHIAAFVTSYSLDVGDEGKAAVRSLLQAAGRQGAAQEPRPLFYDDCRP